MSDLGPDDALTPEDEDLALAAEHVLGLLEGEELRAFEARLGAEPRLRDMVARWTEDFSALLGEAPEVAPPAGTEAALMGRLFPEAPRPGFLQRMGPWLLGAATAAVLVFGVLALGLATQGAEPEYQARLAAEDESLVVLARFDADTRQLEIAREAGDIPEGRDLELWVIQGESVRSLGVIPREPEGVIEVAAELAPDFEGGQLALTVEPIGGSPTGVATGPIVAAGPVTDL